MTVKFTANVISARNKHSKELTGKMYTYIKT